MCPFTKAAKEARLKGNHSVVNRIMRERKMIGTLIDTVLEMGHKISINDGEEWVLKASTDKADILASMFSTDEDILRIDSHGWFQLIYGNDGWDVISDFAVTPITNQIWDDVLSPLSEKLEQQCA